MRLKWRIMRFSLAALALPFAGYANGAGRTEFQRSQYIQVHMGVEVRIAVYAPDAATADRACEAAFGRIAALDDIMSDYRADSELMRLCARAAGEPVPVSDDLFAVLHRAREVSRLTGGAFDVTAGPYVRLWRRMRKTGQAPSERALERAAALVGWEKMRLDPTTKTVRLLARGMQLDLGGIAKGYAIDRALEALKEHGVTRALIEAGGDIVVGDAPPGKDGWRIKIRRAHGQRRFVRLANAAVSTSGDTRQYAEHGGERYSHIVDPRVGLRRGEPIVATIVGRDATTTDALATAACVLGEREAAELIGSMPNLTLYIRRPGRAGGMAK